MQTVYPTIELELEIGDDTYTVITDFEVVVEVDNFSVAGKPMAGVNIRKDSIHVTEISVVDYPYPIAPYMYDNLCEIARKELVANPERIEKILLDKLV